MVSFFKKLIFALLALTIIMFLGIVGAGVFLLYKNFILNQERMEIEHGREDERKKRQQDEEERKKREELLQKAMLDKALFIPEGKASILTHKTTHHLGIRRMQGSELECEKCYNSEPDKPMVPTLIFSEQVNTYLHNVLRDMIDFRNKDKWENDGYNDKNYSPFLKRNNAVMYGAPGTGKTELINELVHHLYERFNDPKIDKIKKEIQELEKRLETDQEKYDQEKNPSTIPKEDPKFLALEKKEQAINEKKKQLKELKEKESIPPVFEIKGAKLQSAGEALKDLNPEAKLIQIIKHYKKKVFTDGEYSDKPYIIFVEEADQGINVMGKSGRADEKNKGLLEEYKNFLSTSEDKQGLKADAQDPNSIIIIATNNYESIDPAVVRRGRLGEKLNFNWNPTLLEKYGKEGDDNYKTESIKKADWPKINWPDHPSWRFKGNPDYEALYRMSTKFGYASFCNKFARNGKANQIIKSWEDMDPEEKKAKETQLGHFKTGKKIKTGEKIKIKGVEVDEEEDEKFCNWLLHFLFTFHRYNDRSEAHNFTDASQIERYDFGDAYFTREAIWGIYSQLGVEVNLLNVTNDIITELAFNAKNIYALLEKTANVRQEMANLKAQVKDLEKGLDNEKKASELSINALKDGIDRINNNSSSSSGDLTIIKSRLTTLESKIAGLGSSGGSTSGLSASAVNSIAELSNRMRALVNELKDTIPRDKYDKFHQIVNDLQRKF